jgi:hypothetical protein
MLVPEKAIIVYDHLKSVKIEKDGQNTKEK